MKQKLPIILILIASAFFGIKSASAATFYLSSDKEIVGIGDAFDVIARIDSEDAGINAGQATIQFPKDIVEVESIDKSDSVFNFWLEEPAFFNENGRVTFIGGSNFGSAGRALKIVTISFKVKGTGQIKLVFTDGAITASDGSGTNVLSTMLGLELTSVPTFGITTVEPKAITEPVQITRPAAIAEGLPSKPELSVPLYPNPEKWHNSAANFIAQWKLPDDVSNLNISLDQSLSYSSQENQGLFESKVFPAINKDGVWYIHARFKNNIGWGPAEHYRLAIDTAPPLGFEVAVLEGEETDNPAPTLQFETSDALSGLKEYSIRINDSEAITIPAADFSGSFTLPLQSPGSRQIAIRATDEANNSSESVLALDILPIASPAITYITKELFSDEEKGLAVKGTALPGVDVLLFVRKKDGTLVANSKAKADEKGNWEYSFDQQFKNGIYAVTAQSQDARGALSLEVKSDEVLIKSKPIIQIGRFQLGMTGALIFLLLVIAAGFGSGAWFYKKRQEKLALRLLVVKSEMAKIFKIIEGDIEKLQKAAATDTAADDEFTMKRLKENVKKMEGYLSKQVEKVKK